MLSIYNGGVFSNVAQQVSRTTEGNSLVCCFAARWTRQIELFKLVLYCAPDEIESSSFSIKFFRGSRKSVPVWFEILPLCGASDHVSLNLIFIISFVWGSIVFKLKMNRSQNTYVQIWRTEDSSLKLKTWSFVHLLVVTDR